MRASLSIILLALPAAAAAPPPIVSLTAGQIRGANLDHGGVVFKGIPFAQPPVMDRRWQPPAPVKPWPGERDATAYGAPCAQNGGGGRGLLANSSEDCLFLNVWNTDWPARSRKPVMLWFHGGGNYAGSASGNNFDGESLARQGVVLVTINYRLTIFGFFAHPELTHASPRHASGNYGLLDQIAALQWIHDNITRFGGDPSNVTIFGQSAGAVDANVLMTSPLAKGLFQRVIAESGTVTRNPDPGTLSMTALGAVMTVKSGPVSYSDAAPLAEAEARGQKLGTLKSLREMSAADLLKIVAAPQMSIGPANGVIVDGWVLPKPPAQVFAAGQEHRVPLLIGNNSRERTPPAVAPDDLRHAIEAMYGPLAPRAFELYRGDATQWVVDTMYRCPAVAQLLWHAAKNLAWEYEFDLGRATHGAEVPYVFGTASDPNIQTYWTNFAKTGNPNGAGSPEWRAFDPKNRQYIEFTSEGPVAGDHLGRNFCNLYVENVNRLLGH